jgi:uncharacterized protein with HEPN domain
MPFLRLRNILIHDYFRVDLLVVREIIENDLPKLKIKIQDMFKQFNVNADAGIKYLKKALSINPVS